MKKYLLLLLPLLFILPGSAHAAIANTGSGNTTQTAGTSHSASISVPAGSNIIFVNAWSQFATPTGVTLNGVAMTKIQTGGNKAGTSFESMWYLVNPSTGTQTLAVTGGGGTTGALWSSYSGASVTGVPDSSTDYSSVSGATKTISTTVVAANSWLVLTTADNTGNASAGSGTTQRAYNTSWALGIYDSNGTVGTGSQSLQITRGSAFNIYATIASFAPEASAPTSLVGLEDPYWIW